MSFCIEETNRNQTADFTHVFGDGCDGFLNIVARYIALVGLSLDAELFPELPDDLRGIGRAPDKGKGRSMSLSLKRKD
jgi:hypothetical protein